EVRIIVRRARLRTSESKDTSQLIDSVWLRFRSPHSDSRWECCGLLNRHTGRRKPILTAPDGNRPCSVQVELHSVVRGGEAEALVKAAGIVAGLVGRELDNARATLARHRDRRLDQLAADACAALRRRDAHALDLCALGAEARESWNEGELQ